jgi:hypothetical protein
MCVAFRKSRAFFSYSHVDRLVVRFPLIMALAPSKFGELPTTLLYAATRSKSVPMQAPSTPRFGIEGWTPPG